MGADAAVLSAQNPRVSPDPIAFQATPNGPRHLLVLGVEDALGQQFVERLVTAGHLIAAYTLEGTLTTPSGTGFDLSADKRQHGWLSALLANTEIVCFVAKPFDEPISAMSFHLAWPRRRQRERLLASLADALPDHPQARLILRSSAALYDDAGRRWVDGTFPLWPPKPAAATWRAEQLAVEHTQLGGDAVVLRTGTPYGLGDDTSERRVALARRGWEPFLGPSDAYRPMLDINDAAGAFGAALDAPPGVYNIAENNPLTVAQLNAAVEVALGLDTLHSFVPSLHRSQYPLISRSCRLSNASFRRLTDWSPAGPPLASVLHELWDRGDRQRSGDHALRTGRDAVNMGSEGYVANDPGWTPTGGST